MKAISVDLGGTHATVALVEDRNILATEVIGLERVDGLDVAVLRSSATSDQPTTG